MTAAISLIATASSSLPAIRVIQSSTNLAAVLAESAPLTENIVRRQSERLGFAFTALAVLGQNALPC